MLQSFTSRHRAGYTFKHTFTGVTGGPLVVNLQVMPSGTSVPLGTWVRGDPTDIIGATVGGNRYGWFAQNEFDGLAIDNSFRTGILSTPDCELKINDGGWIVALNTDQATFGGNAKVSSSGVSTGQQEYQDHGPIQPLNFKAIDVTAVTCSSDRRQASIFGHATVNGAGSFEHQIDLTDNGEPGINDMYRILIPGVPYESGAQRLQGGNIQIRAVRRFRLHPAIWATASTHFVIDAYGNMYAPLLPLLIPGLVFHSRRSGCWPCAISSPARSPNSDSARSRIAGARACCSWQGLSSRWWCSAQLGP